MMKVSQNYVHIIFIYLCFNLETEYFKKMTEVTNYISSSTLFDSMQDMRAIKTHHRHSTRFINYENFTVFRKSVKGQNLEGKKCRTCARVHASNKSSTSNKSNKLFFLKTRVDFGTEKKGFPIFCATCGEQLGKQIYFRKFCCVFTVA